VSVAWTDNATTETGFIVQRSDNGGAFATIATLAALAATGLVNYVDATAQFGNSYVYQVAAVNGPSPSAFSNTADATLLSAPTGLTATLEAGPQVALSWTDTATNETGFVIERSDNGGPFALLAAPAANPGTGSVAYLDATVQAGNTYVYQVRAVSGAFASANSNTASVTVGAAPAAPTNLRAVLQTSRNAPPRVALSFRDNATNETGFVVERAANGGFFTPLATLAARRSTGSVTYTDTTVTAGNTYAYRVRAVNGAAMSAYSNTATAALAAAPAAPSNFTAAAAATSSRRARISLSWTDNSNNETQFVIRRATAIDGSGNLLNPTTFTVNRSSSQSASVGGTVTFTQSRLARGTTYYYQILARNAFGDSVWVNLDIFPITTP